MEDGMALPEDVLIEILVKLPIKSLLRFSCVSKYWFNLIRSPNFVSRHSCRDWDDSLLVMSKLPQPPQGIEGGGGREVFSFHDPDSVDLLVSPSISVPPFLDNLVGDGVVFDFMGTCNGLVCLTFNNIVILCNPVLREFELLPLSSFECPEGYRPRWSASGFGFDAMINAFKVVQLSEIINYKKGYPECFEDAWMRTDLYDSSTNSWRLIDAVVPKAVDGSNIFLNGACHWHGEPSTIISLNLSTEVFRCFEFPYIEDQKLLRLLILNQCLAVAYYADFEHRANNVHVVDIWVMREYGVKESWTKEFVIGPCPRERPLLFLKNEWLLVQSTEEQLASRALYGNEIRGSRVHMTSEYVQVEIFKASLISLKQVMHTNT